MRFTPFFINHNLPRPLGKQTFEQTMYDTAGNTGNAYITYSLSKLLKINHNNIHGIRNIWVDIEKIDANTISEINSNYSHLILIMQDQVREQDSYYAKIPFDKIGLFLEQIQIPFIVVSLGHNSFGTSDYDHNLHKKIPPHLVRLLSILSHKSNSLGVRGYYTAEILKKIGISNVAVVGCPSLFSPGPTRGLINKKPWDSNLRIGLTGALSHIDIFPNAYSIFQDINESVFIKLSNYRDEFLIKDYDELYSMPSSVRDALLKHSLLGRTRFFTNFEAWESFLSTMDFVVGSRMHGAIVSLNAGTPASVTSGDSRAKEMCDLFQIPLFAGRDDIEILYQKSDFTNFNKNYGEIYATFIDFLSRSIDCENLDQIKTGILGGVFGKLAFWRRS